MPSPRTGWLHVGFWCPFDTNEVKIEANGWTVDVIHLSKGIARSVDLDSVEYFCCDNKGKVYFCEHSCNSRGLTLTVSLLHCLDILFLAFILPSLSTMVNSFIDIGSTHTADVLLLYGFLCVSIETFCCSQLRLLAGRIDTRSRSR